MEFDESEKEIILLFLQLGVKEVTNIERLSLTRTRYTIVYWVDGYQIEQNVIVTDRRYSNAGNL